MRTSAVTRYNVINNDEVFSNDAWRPIQELEVPDADLGVYFLQMKDIRYLEPVTDLWFEALDKVVNRGKKFGNQTSYATELPIRALACVQQYQFCRPSLEEVENCTPLNGIFEATRIASSTLFPQPKDSERFLWSLRAIRDMAGGFHELVKQLKGGSLLASDYVSDSGQGGLPDNQWELELEHWFKFTMADLQRAILDQATGPAVPEAVPFFSAPTSPEARALCGSQKIRSDSYTSFNVLGLILMFSIGGLIMLIAACLPSVTARLQRKKPFSSIEWVTNDTLQLQRLAHEAVGAGQWQGACDDYPRTRKGDLLAVIDISNKEHPVLRAPAAAEMVKEAEQAKEFQDEEQGMEEQRSEGSVEEWSEGLNVAGPRGERKAEWQRNDSIHESLMSVEIPRVSLELSHRFAAGIC
ncbi:uncharacterized protein J4E88_005551 [Alternaria novae-zelandiae]|uniref:uncharacterized protein n=1 Tax=Alternaria novae-zelandiae TaxID=430562 RepID=UPI0020C46C4D|nr:uncharacterized protein J4E88_005551 [Alternaria novae-zelandiae]KAI4681046.1 hypothetical protein J4E88_005551 [Alternaria novae-zelandiae]